MRKKIVRISCVGSKVKLTLRSGNNNSEEKDIWVSKTLFKKFLECRLSEKKEKEKILRRRREEGIGQTVREQILDIMEEDNNLIKKKGGGNKIKNKEEKIYSKKSLSQINKELEDSAWYWIDK